MVDCAFDVKNVSADIFILEDVHRCVHYAMYTLCTELQALSTNRIYLQITQLYNLYI